MNWGCVYVYVCVVIGGGIQRIIRELKKCEKFDCIFKVLTLVVLGLECLASF